ncbi:MAG: hypothetical protein HC782_01215 [Gammaproteobacteria bacterium]|nr:hypothetical protein [Gammaproteobacteria bacterium]
MKNSIYLRAVLFNVVASFTLAIISMMMVTKAFAQSVETPPSYTPRISVVPAVARVGVERTVTVSGVWPTGCIPTALTPSREAVALTRALPLRLEISQTLVACTQAITSYEYRTTFTPTRAGDIRLIVYTAEGIASNETLMAVQSLDSTQSLYNLTGMWYDPATSGSGIVFVHSYSTTDTVFGAWFIYDQKGDARWYSAQEGRWRNDTEWNGVLYETSAAPNGCTPNLSACPQQFKSLRRVGTARVTMTGRNEAKLDALAADGSVLFSSNLVKGL